MYPGLSDQDCELKVKILHFEVQSQNSEMRVIRVNLQTEKSTFFSKHFSHDSKKK